MKKNGILRKLMAVSMATIIVMLLASVNTVKALDFSSFIDIDSTGTSQSGQSSQVTTTTQEQPTTTTTTKKSTETTTAATTGNKDVVGSGSKDSEMPNTGSNIEIIFGVGAVVLIGATMFVYKKSKIKLN